MSWFFCVVYGECQQPNNSYSVEIKFGEVFEVLQTAIINIEDGKGIVPQTFRMDADLPLFFTKCEYEKDWDLHFIFMTSVLYLINIITKLEMNADQLLSFNKIVYRLVRCQLKTQQGQTLLHLSVLQHIYSEFPGLFQTTFLEVLLECGANVNAVDKEHKTALHLCSQGIQDPDMTQLHDVVTRIAVLLLKNSAHVDMVDIFGERAVDGLTSSLMEIQMMDFVTLKCLAANAVVKYKIPHVGYVNGLLESFVHVHGICEPSGKIV